MSPIQTLFQFMFGFTVTLLGIFWSLLSILMIVEPIVERLLTPVMPILNVGILPLISWMQDALTLCFPVDDTIARIRIEAHATTVGQRIEQALLGAFGPIINIINGLFGLCHWLADSVRGIGLHLVNGATQYGRKPIDLLLEPTQRLQGKFTTLYDEGVRFLQGILGITYILAVCAKLQKQREDDELNTRPVAIEAGKIEPNEGTIIELRASLNDAHEKISVLENTKNSKCPCQRVNLNIGRRTPVSSKKVQMNKLRRHSTWVATNILPPRPKVELPQRAATAPNTPDLSGPTEMEARPASLRRRAISNLNRLRDRFGLPHRK